MAMMAFKLQKDNAKGGKEISVYGSNVNRVTENDRASRLARIHRLNLDTLRRVDGNPSTQNPKGTNE